MLNKRIVISCIGTGIVGIYIIKKIKDKREMEIFENVFNKFNVDVNEYDTVITDLPGELVDEMAREYKKLTGKNLYEKILKKEVNK
jgi:hypothetical protein